MAKSKQQRNDNQAEDRDEFWAHIVVFPSGSRRARKGSHLSLSLCLCLCLSQGLGLRLRLGLGLRLCLRLCLGLRLSVCLLCVQLRELGGLLVS
jgi:hypothetical protein